MAIFDCEKLKPQNPDNYVTGYGLFTIALGVVSKLDTDELKDGTKIAALRVANEAATGQFVEETGTSIRRFCTTPKYTGRALFSGAAASDKTVTKLFGDGLNGNLWVVPEECFDNYVKVWNAGIHVGPYVTAFNLDKLVYPFNQYRPMCVGNLNEDDNRMAISSYYRMSGIADLPGLICTFQLFCTDPKNRSAQGSRMFGEITSDAKTWVNSFAAVGEHAAGHAGVLETTDEMRKWTNEMLTEILKMSAKHPKMSWVPFALALTSKGAPRWVGTELRTGPPLPLKWLQEICEAGKPLVIKELHPKTRWTVYPPYTENTKILPRAVLAVENLVRVVKCDNVRHAIEISDKALNQVRLDGTPRVDVARTADQNGTETDSFDRFIIATAMPKQSFEQAALMSIKSDRCPIVALRGQERMRVAFTQFNSSIHALLIRMAEFFAGKAGKTDFPENSVMLANVSVLGDPDVGETVIESEQLFTSPKRNSQHLCFRCGDQLKDHVVDGQVCVSIRKPAVVPVWSCGWIGPLLKSKRYRVDPYNISKMRGVPTRTLELWARHLQGKEADLSITRQVAMLDEVKTEDSNIGEPVIHEMVVDYETELWKTLQNARRQRQRADLIRMRAERRRGPRRT